MAVVIGDSDCAASPGSIKTSASEGKAIMPMRGVVGGDGLAVNRRGGRGIET